MSRTITWDGRIEEVIHAAEAEALPVAAAGTVEYVVQVREEFEERDGSGDRTSCGGTSRRSPWHRARSAAR
jgi:hypothetical protein